MKIPEDVAGLIRIGAPTLATAFGGPGAGIAAKLAADALLRWLDPAVKAGERAPTPEDIARAVQANKDDPKVLPALRQAEEDLRTFEANNQFRFAQLEVQDRQGARDFQIDSGGAGAVRRQGFALVYLALALMFLTIAGALVLISGLYSIPADAAGVVAGLFSLVGVVIGYVNGWASQIISFYYGSSDGSRKKTEEITSALREFGAAAVSRASTEAAQSPPAPAPAPPPLIVVPPVQTAPQPAPPVAGRPSRFTAVIDKLLEHEGGYSDHPADPGKCTHRGITIGTLRDWRDEAVTCEDVRALTPEEAKAIYFARYWNAMSCDGLPPGLDYAVFDFGVNAGPARAAKFLQRILAKRDPSLKQDGVIGPLTLAIAARVPASELIEEFHAARMAHYHRQPTFKDFGAGWTRRAEEVLAAARSATATA